MKSIYKILAQCMYVRAYRRLCEKLCISSILSSRKFYGRYGDLIKHYEVSLSKMLPDIVGHDRIQ